MKLRASLYLIPLATLIIFPGLHIVKAYVIKNSTNLLLLDREKKCDNYNNNSSLSCFSVGRQAGLIDGAQHKNNHFVYSVVNGCASGESPNYCAGFIDGYSIAFGHYPNASEYFNIVNNTAMNDAMSADAVPTSKVISNIPTFCHIYLSTYSQVFPTNAPFYAGREAGEKFADHVLSICHEPGRLQIPPGHSNSWQTGYSEGYGDWISDAANDDGTYGANKCHFG